MHPKQSNFRARRDNWSPLVLLWLTPLVVNRPWKINYGMEKLSQWREKTKLHLNLLLLLLLGNQDLWEYLHPFCPLYEFLKLLSTFKLKAKLCVLMCSAYEQKGYLLTNNKAAIMGSKQLIQTSVGITCCSWMEWRVLWSPLLINIYTDTYLCAFWMRRIGSLIFTHVTLAVWGL